MSYYVTHENSVLNINNAHLKVSGNVHTDVLKLGAMEFAPPASDVPGTVNFTNVTTGVTTTSNLNVGGTLMLGSVELVTSTSALEQTVNLGNTTSNTVQFTNATTGFVTTANVEVGGELTVSGNVEVGTANLFVDTVNSMIGIGTTSPQQKLEVHGNILLGQNQVKSFIHGGNSVAVSSDADVLIVADSNDTSGAIGSNSIIFGAGSATDTDVRDFTYAQAYPNDVPRVELMRITGSGSVGVGTSSPDHKLHIYDDSSTDPVYLKVQSETYNRAGIILGEDSGDICIMEYDGTGADAGNYLAFYSGITNWISKGDGLNFIPYNGRVGLGTASPEGVLHIYRGSADLLYLQKTTSSGGVGIRFSTIAGANANQNGYLRYYHEDSVSYGLGNSFKFTTDQTSETVSVGGCLHIGVDGKDGGYMTNTTGSGRKNLFIQSTYGTNTSQTHGWWIGAQNQTPSSTDNDLYFAVVRSGTIKLCGTMLDQNNANLNFTGQHRTFVKDTPTNQLDSKEGLIVVADQNEFVKMSGGVAYGKDAITINESLPLVSLSTKSNDKKCFGVLSTTEDPETRKEIHGNFGSFMIKEEGDTRVYVNSVGEGAIWVVNTNGALESGDYITTSNVAGYGMKQDDDILHNYTVAKILMDCDFNPVTQPKRIIRKESRMIDYWIRYGDVKINEEEYQSLPETKRKIVEDVHYRIDQMDVRKEDPEKDTFVYEQREEMVNVLDEHGEFQWEETGETEKAYKIRYLDADGNITDEANAVHTAAFVGCTYHCG
jgi:hypothetical protein